MPDRHAVCGPSEAPRKVKNDRDALRAVPIDICQNRGVKYSRKDVCQKRSTMTQKGVRVVAPNTYLSQKLIPNQKLFFHRTHGGQLLDSDCRARTVWPQKFSGPQVVPRPTGGPKGFESRLTKCQVVIVCCSFALISLVDHRKLPYFVCAI